MKFIHSNEMVLHTPYLFCNNRYNYVGFGVFNHLDQLNILKYTEYIGFSMHKEEDNMILSKILNESELILVLADDIINYKVFLLIFTDFH